jgi:2-polyprenyl-6-hydroxyphenyl methylase/3-demethylubiquinone-9 3-methyltransferase
MPALAHDSPIRARSRRNDLALYDRAAAEWWAGDSPAFRSLRRIKSFHLELLVERWGPQLAGSHVVDLGCGGGLLALPLGAQGARATGIDVSAPSLGAGRSEAVRRRLDAVRFVHADLRATPLATGCADFVLLADIVEHLDSPGTALAEAARLLRAGGQLFVSTINRTLRARWLAITVAEGLRLVPRGTHDPRLFVRPDELAAQARAVGLEPSAWIGESPRILATIRRWAIALRRSRSLAVTYSGFFVKRSGGTT